MASLIFKRKQGREYAYIVQSARVHGKPRIVQQIYLGPKDRFLRELQEAYTRSQTPGPVAVRKLEVKKFGASAWLWQQAQELQLIEIIDRHVPALESRRRTPLSVGQYLVLAAINRAVGAQSKRSFYDYWYRQSVISRLCPAEASQLSSQRFWDHMDQVEPAHIEAIQLDLLARLEQEFALGSKTLLYDTTNYFSFIDTYNERSRLAQRGHNKQKRTDLRQLSLALFEDEASGLPLYHQCYGGDRPDVSQAGAAWQGMLQAWMRSLERPPEQLTLVFDQGNTSKRNLHQLEDCHLHWVGALPTRWVPDLLEVGLKHYEKLCLPPTKHLQTYRCRRALWNREVTLVLVFSPSLYVQQRAAQNRLQAKVEQQLRQLAEAIGKWSRSHRGQGHREESVRRKIRQWTRRDHLQEFLEIELQTEAKRVTALQWSWNLSKKRAVQRRYFGKSLLFTDQDEWDTASIVKAYRKLYRNEHLFRLSKGRQGPWWPMYHWTDSKVRVHALYCYLALLLLSILKLKLREADLTLSVQRAVQQLESIEEALVVYRNRTADRVLSEMSSEQRTLAGSIGLLDLAKKMGTTVLKTQ